ncbi:copper resistance protein B [Pseudoroseomonas ludipueritiae]|uniref:Copper resistance protein B n=1 Tax=Pseudoroseomonas ludipueritiae TaxID=198093 RepID=A0ABR7RAF7_9PROT|nr:copper resistance protein B [Pseudoroseomonas ludipueritiae]MBC9178745.1 copper resistance protein B [Pseudoroseomonas ludipueritiae]
MRTRSILTAATSLAVLASGVFQAVPAQAQAMQHSTEPSFSHEVFTGAVLFEKLEYGWGLDGPNIGRWDGQAWYGGDVNRVWLKTEGETKRNGTVESAEAQLLYSRLLGYYWDFQAGVRYDIRPRPDRFYGVIGLQGLAPGMFEVDVQGFVSEKGDLSARAEVSYDAYITQRLVLQPNAEVNLALQKVPELGVGSGFNDVEAGLRLRYEFTREVSPYIGVSYERKLGDTARYARNEGEDVGGWAFLTGIRLFF